MLTDVREALEAMAAEAPPRDGCVRLEQGDSVAHITLDFPAARNAMTARMMCQLCEAVQAIAASDVAVIVLDSAEGGAFCAGGHLGDVTEVLTQPGMGRQMARAMSAVLDALGALPAVSITAVEGAAIGGGAEIAISTDFRVFGSGASLHFVHTRLGVVPGWGGGGRLVDLVGRRVALRLLCDAASIDASECARLGLADEVVDEGGASAKARAWAGELVRRPEAVRAAKRVVLARGRRAETARNLESHAFAEVWGGPAHVEALQKVLTRSRGRG